jgi:hypothetical protein
VNVATYIHHCAGTEHQQLLNELVITPLAWWINNDYCFIWGQLLNDGEYRLGLSSTEDAFFGDNIVERDIVPSGSDRFLRRRTTEERIISDKTFYADPASEGPGTTTYLGDFYSDDRSEKRGQCDGEQSTPTVRIDEMFGFLPNVACWGGQYSGPYIFGEWHEDRIVVLEERICGEFK